MIVLSSARQGQRWAFRWPLADPCAKPHGL